MTQSTTTFRRGAVVVVPYPFSELSVIKNRPALVLSSSEFLDNRHDVILAAITSRIRDPLLTGDYMLKDWSECGLPRPSVVTAILRTAKTYRVFRKVGEVSDRDLRSYEAVLRRSLGL